MVYSLSPRRGVGMVIPVNKKYRIASDRNSWMVQEWSVVKGEDRWETFGWYGDLDGAVKGLMKLEVREIPDAFGVREVLTRMGEIEHEIIGSLTPYLEWCEKGRGLGEEADNITRQ